MKLGLSHKMKNYFIAAKVETYNDFYRIAEAAEKHLKSKPYFQNKLNTSKFTQRNNSIDKSKIITSKPFKPPPNPCRICANLGFQNRYHWAQNCTNKNRKTQTIETNRPVNTAKVNLVETNEENF